MISSGPRLYEAWHEAKPVTEPSYDTPVSNVDIVGPVCETGDFLAQDRPLPHMDSGDLVAIMSAGAYGARCRPALITGRLLVPEVLVSGDKWHVIRERKSYDALLALDSVPDWLEE